MKHSLEELKELYEKILLVRLCEQQIMKEYFFDEMKTPVHLSIGSEAISSVVQMIMPQTTKFFGTYRNHALYLVVTKDTNSFFAEMYGKETGCAKGKAGSMHLSSPDHGLIATSAVVGTTIPVATGAALTSKLLKNNAYVCCFFGDGAVEEGAFYESLNFASLKQLPILYICEDNDLAIHSSRREREGFKSLKSLVEAFNIEYISGDGTNPQEALALTKAIFQKMKDTGKPGFLHLSYFRFLEHVGPLEDFNKGYRTRPDLLDEKFDPLLKLKKELLSIGVEASFFTDLEDKILYMIHSSVEFAKNSKFPDPKELYTDVLV
jgi:TPP-dependent pyruvate/acetoin dehydrogenase alpha subunit